MEYITSDLHFWHKNILKFNPENRSFSNVNEMNDYLITHWNSTVKKNDTIYHLGDISLGSKNKTYDILKELNGNIVFIKGNHDHKSVLSHFGDVYDYLELKVNETFVVLMHYPLHFWNKQHFGSVHLFGHTHGRFKGIGRSIDVGYDVHGRILTLNEAIQLAKNKEEINYK